MIVFIIIILALIFILYILLKENIKLKEELSNLESQLKSKSIKFGKWIEDYFPFLKNFEEPENFKFIGEPIDGIGFNTDKIIFYEFKTGSAKLTDKERRIKNMVDNKKVEWKEIRI